MKSEDGLMSTENPDNFKHVYAWNEITKNYDLEKSKEIQ